MKRFQISGIQLWAAALQEAKQDHPELVTDARVVGGFHVSENGDVTAFFELQEPGDPLWDVKFAAETEVGA